MSKDNLKSRFAEMMLRHPNRITEHAKALAGSNFDLAWTIVQDWPFDADVRAMQAELLRENGEEAYLPTRFDAARAAYAFSENASLAAKDRIAGLQLYGMFMKMLDRPLDGDKPKSLEAIVREILTDAEPVRR